MPVYMFIRRSHVLSGVVKYILIASAFISLSCFAQGENDIVVIDKFTGQLFTEMLEILGPPVDKTAYTIKNAPAKSWNHQELFSKYPLVPENEHIQIMEVLWDNDGFMIFACFHMVDGENRCLVAKRIRKGIKF